MISNHEWTQINTNFILTIVRLRIATQIDPASVTDSLFSGLGVKRFSHLLIEGIAFAFRCEAFVFGLDRT